MEIYRNELTVIPVTLPTGAAYSSVRAYRDGVLMDPAPTGVSNAGVVSVTLPYSQYQLDGEIRIVVVFDIGATAGAEIEEFVNIVTPILKKTSSNANDYSATEPIVRHVIQSYTGQSFGKWTGSYTLEGNDGLLYLPDHIISLSSMTYQGVRYTTSAFEVKGDGWYIGYRYGLYPTVDAIVDETEAGVITPPRRYSPNKVFRNDIFYTVSGTFGYNYVPDKVAQAAKLLFDDYACKDSTYRDRYLKSIRSADWRLEFNSGAWQGTGNVKADLLLDEYRRGGMVVF